MLEVFKRQDVGRSVQPETVDPVRERYLNPILTKDIKIMFVVCAEESSAEGEEGNAMESDNARSDRENTKPNSSCQNVL